MGLLPRTWLVRPQCPLPAGGLCWVDSGNGSDGHLCIIMAPVLGQSVLSTAKE